jgi:DNA-binding MarR family transcriptional regulator
MSENDLSEVVNVDRLIHEPARLAIMTILYVVESADFLYLLRETGLTRGNLSSHLSRLEEAAYIEIEKTFEGKTPRTLCRQTEAGRAAFDAYAAQIRGVLGHLVGGESAPSAG